MNVRIECILFFRLKRIGNEKFILMCAMLGFAAQSHAVSGSWSKDTLHYTIYASNTAATMPFRSTTYMSTGASYVTSLSWQWTPYANGNFSGNKSATRLSASARPSMQTTGCARIRKAVFLTIFTMRWPCPAGWVSLCQRHTAVQAWASVKLRS